jgi:hypothetical protein
LAAKEVTLKVAPFLPYLWQTHEWHRHWRCHWNAVVTGDGDTAPNRRHGRSGNKQSAGFLHIALLSRLHYSDELALKPPLKCSPILYGKRIKAIKSNTYSRRGRVLCEFDLLQKIVSNAL